MSDAAFSVDVDTLRSTIELVNTALKALEAWSEDFRLTEADKGSLVSLQCRVYSLQLRLPTQFTAGRKRCVPWVENRPEDELASVEDKPEPLF